MDLNNVRRVSSASYRLPERACGTGATTSRPPADRTRRAGRGRGGGGGDGATSADLDPERDRNDPVRQDRVRQEMVWSEKRGVREWEKKWSFLKNYDQMGRPKSEEPLPSHVSVFSDRVPNTGNQMIGSRLSTPIGIDVVRLDRLSLRPGGYHRYIVFVTYQMYYDYPPPTYLEYPILIAQDAILLLLMLHYNGSLRQSLIYAVLFVGGWRLLTVEKWIVDLAMSLCTFISAASKFAQLQCLWRSKDGGQVSALSWAMATYTCAVRIYTTMATTGDTQVLVRFVSMTLLNLWVLLTVLYYQRHGSRSKKED